jgi:hypothetical protein
MFTHQKLAWNAAVVGGILASAIASSAAQAAAPAPTPAPSAQTAPTAPKRPAAGKPYRYRTTGLPKSAREYYGLVWGVDTFSVKSVESGEIIRFSYRVLDPAKAKVLNSKKSEPALLDPGAGVSLVVPSLEKVGQLRQSITPEGGKTYWMAFSNKGRKVKSGDRVNIVIGTFKAEGLTVE